MPSGAQLENTNAMLHGLTARPGGKRAYLTLGKLPTGCGGLRRDVLELSRRLAYAVLERRGVAVERFEPNPEQTRYGNEKALEQHDETVWDQLTPYERACCSTACKWEQHGQLALRWLRQSFAELTWDQRLTFSREVAQASANRDKALRALGLDRAEAGDVLTLLYATPSNGHGQEHQQDHDAAQATPERSAATQQAQDHAASGVKTFERHGTAQNEDDFQHGGEPQ